MARNLLRGPGSPSEGKNLFSGRNTNQQQPKSEPRETYGWGDELANIGDYGQSAVTGFNTAIERPVHGILQPLLENDYVPNWLKGASNHVAQSRERAYEEESQKNPLTTMLGNIGGDVALSLPFLAGGGVAGTPLMNILNGALAGAGGGAAQYGDVESRLKKALMGGAIGGGGAAASEVAKGLWKGGKELMKLPGQYKASHPDILAPKIAQFAENKVTQSSKDYDKFLNSYGKIKNEVKIPEKEWNYILKAASKDEKEIFKGLYKEANTIEGVHNLNKALGRFERRLGRNASPNDFQIDASKYAKKSRDKLKNSIENTLTKQENSVAGREYSHLSERYKKEIVPLKKNKSLIAKAEGGLTNEDFLSRLKTDKDFRARFQEHFPEFGKRQQIQGMAKGVAKSAGYGFIPSALGAGAYHLFSGKS